MLTGSSNAGLTSTFCQMNSILLAVVVAKIMFLLYEKSSNIHGSHSFLVTSPESGLSNSSITAEICVLWQCPRNQTVF